MVRMVVVTFKEAVIVINIGIFDLRASASAAFGTGGWVAYCMETYLIVALIYWAFITALGRLGAYSMAWLRQGEH